jgi:hypothetical protein
MRHFVVAGTRKQNQFSLAIAVSEVGDNRTHQNGITDRSGVKESYSFRMGGQVTLFPQQTRCGYQWNTGITVQQPTAFASSTGRSTACGGNVGQLCIHY